MDALIFGAPGIVWLAAGLALYMAWTIGANDVANAMGTSVGSGALTIFRAVVVAGILEFCGAFLAGGHVTDTVRKGILVADFAAGHEPLIVYGMLASLMSAGTLLLAATRFGLPVSTTHAIVGAIVGFGAVGLGVDSVVWGKVAQIVVTWVTSPLIGGVLAFLIFNLTRYLILDREAPMAQARRIGPIFFFVVFFVISLVTVFKGLKQLRLHLDFSEAAGVAALVGVLGALIGRFFLRRVSEQPDPTGSDRFRQVEKVFVVLQILTACSVAFAHGSNDVANAIGPLAAVIQLSRGAAYAAQASVAPWMLVVGGVGIVIGLATWGYRVMETVGRKITELTPSRGFSAELAAALTIVLASRLGIPVSTTHILVGSVFGVGLARGIGALDLQVVGKILVSWIATLPLAAGLSIFFFYFFKGLLSP
ncbi:MAG: inorganic phosphate transporter [Myxococcales bacterium]|nr:inorganic phosphate transporter [Myxococcales bacterium]